MSLLNMMETTNVDKANGKRSEMPFEDLIHIVMVSCARGGLLISFLLKNFFLLLTTQGHVTGLNWLLEAGVYHLDAHPGNVVVSGEMCPTTMFNLPD